MTQEEKYGKRDLTYSNWHRYPNLPKHFCWVDIDACEYCDSCKEPLALIELAIDVGQEYKTATVTRNLAIDAGIPAYVAFYKLGEAMIQNGNIEHREITGFRMRQIAPYYRGWAKLTPEKYIEWLGELRDGHQCKPKE